MATNRDLLKEAIADAKAVKDMAIANAKAALEESFTPQLTAMLSAKLQEIEEEDELEEAGFGPMSGVKGHGNIEDDTSHSIYEEEEDELEEDLDLESLLKELNENEEEEEETEEEESEESEETEEGEPLDLENMTDEDLKKMIEDVIADMMGSGELELEKPEEEEMPEKEEINLDELLAEIASLEEDDSYEDESESEYEDELEEGKEEVEEAMFADPNLGNTILSGLEFAAAGGSAVLIAFIAWVLTKLGKKGDKAAEGALKAAAEEYKRTGDKKKFLAAAQAIKAGKPAPAETTKTSPELAEAYSTIETLRKDLNEVNLLNAKLLYTNKIFKAKNLTESQKVNVLGMFDKATNVGEVKLVFETLSEGLKAKPSPIKESLGSASKTLGTTNTKQPIVESNDMVARFQKLAGIIKS